MLESAWKTRNVVEPLRDVEIEAVERVCREVRGFVLLERERER